MNLLDLFENKTSALTEGVRVVDQDYDLDQIILTMDINGRPVSFTYTDYDEDFDNAERGDVHDQLQRHDWYAALSHPDRMEILDAAYRAIRGEEPGEYRPTVDDEPLDEQGVAEGHADQQRKIFKKNGKPVGEVGIDRESSPGVGQYYMKHYASGTDNSGYDSFEEAVEELRHLAKQGVAEAMKPSDIPPSRRDRLTMRDIEAERPQGAYRFKVVTPQGDSIDFMDRSAADSRAKATGGRVEPIDPQPQGLPGRNRFRVQDPEGTRPAATFRDRVSAERYAAAKRLPVEIIPEAQGRKGASARIERILKMLRARHPQAENDLEALIFDFRGQQAQDRTDIARLDAENDMEEADIQRLEKMLDLVRRRRGAETVATESLRDREYHVATVTLDDGSVKRIPVTQDAGFRELIQQHFAKQGRKVQDIKMDYSVQTEAAKKKPQPTNPELWGRAKSAARSKFDVYPSAYANAWAAKWYKSKGGGWRMGKPKKK